jgi:hypothetical protein
MSKDEGDSKEHFGTYKKINVQLGAMIQKWPKKHGESDRIEK